MPRDRLAIGVGVFSLINSNRTSAARWPQQTVCCANWGISPRRSCAVDFRPATAPSRASLPIGRGVRIIHGEDAPAAVAARVGLERSDHHHDLRRQHRPPAVRAILLARRECSQKPGLAEPPEARQRCASSALSPAGTEEAVPAPLASRIAPPRRRALIRRAMASASHARSHLAVVCRTSSEVSPPAP